MLKKVFDFLSWKKLDEGKIAELPRIDESHKEMLFTKWDSHLKKAEQAMEEAVTVANNVIKCINENLHKENLILEATPGFLPKAQKL